MLALLVIIVAVCAAILLPETACAWGPSTHILVGQNLLETLSGSSTTIARLLTAYPMDFLYGSVFADMNLGKKFFVFARLAHNWRVGYKLVESAEDEHNLACAYGYLAHLAADTVAHNQYIPRKLVEEYLPKGRGHLFFEIAFDATLPEDPGRISRQVVGEGSAQNDVFLESTLTRTLFSFGTNRRLFKGILSVNRNNGVRAYRQWRARSIGIVTPSELEEYIGKCESAVMDVFTRERASEPYGVDPHGKFAIKQATRLRRKLREKTRQSEVSPDEVREALTTLRKASNGQR